MSSTVPRFVVFSVIEVAAPVSNDATKYGVGVGAAAGMIACPLTSKLTIDSLPLAFSVINGCAGESMLEFL